MWRKLCSPYELVSILLSSEAPDSRMQPGTHIAYEIQMVQLFSLEQFAMASANLYTTPKMKH